MVEHEAGVGDGGGVGGVDPREILVQAGRCDWLVQATRGKRGGHALGHGRQGRVVRKQFDDVTEADADAVDLVRIGRTDAATGGSDHGVQTVQQPVVAEDDVGTLRDEQPLPTDLLTGLSGPALQLLVEDPGVDHHAVPKDEPAVLAGDARRKQVELEHALTKHHRVACVVATLKAGHHARAFGKPVHQLAFSLVAPLRTQDDGRWHVLTPEQRRHDRSINLPESTSRK